MGCSAAHIVMFTLREQRNTANLTSAPHIFGKFVAVCRATSLCLTERLQNLQDTTVAELETCLIPTQLPNSWLRTSSYAGADPAGCFYRYTRDALDFLFYMSR